MRIDVRGIPEVQAALGKFDAKRSKAMLQKASTAGAKVLKGYVRSATPKGATGALRRSIRSGQTKRLRPAARVWAQKDINRTRARNTTFYRHMVAGGTRAHGPRTAQFLIFRPDGSEHNVWARHVRGTPPRPFMEQGFTAGRVAAEAAIDAIVEQYLAEL